MNRKEAIDELIKSTDDFTSEEFDIFCLYFALLVNPETRAKAVKFSDEVARRKTLTLPELKDFCLTLQAELILK